MEGSVTSSSGKRVTVVTGANKGIGLEICRQLASNGVTVVLTARDEKRGAAAVGTLRGLGLSDVVFHQLDVGEPSGAARLADFVREKFGKLDILVNNAGIPGVTTEIGDPAALHEVFFRGEELKQELDNIDNLSKERLDELSQLFLQDFKNGQLEPHGWPVEGGFSAYKASKALINAYTRVLAKEHASLRVNCVHPGYVKTDVNFHTGDLTVDEGARGPVMLALMPKGGPTGSYFDGTEMASFV